jgi:hypothetical protein
MHFYKKKKLKALIFSENHLITFSFYAVRAKYSFFVNKRKSVEILAMN